ncbi:MAG: O-antigen ligase family protein [Thermoleophilaceae bacterium]|nr:O-antigen ligase family protein [Thermoleophilaceae bacterium]
MLGHRRLAGLLLLLPGALTVYLAFNAGGFFPTAPGIAACALAIALVLRVTVAPRPFEGFGPWAATAAAATGLLCVWVLVSSAWSDAPGRAVLELSRGLLYLFAFVLFASLARVHSRLSWGVRGLAAGIYVVCGAGLITRIAPDVWPVSPNVANNRLSYPITYWNALGLLAAVGIVLCLHLACSEREPRAARVLGAAALPALGTTLLFTFSRGGIAATAVAVVAYLALGRPRALATGVLASAPVTAIALKAAYDADRLSTYTPTGPEAVHQGHHVALAVGLCTAAGLLLRAVMLMLDDRLAWVRLSSGARRQVRTGAAVAAAVAAVALTVGLDLPGRVDRQYHRFVNGTELPDTADLRTRLGDPGNNGRLPLWRVSLDEFRASPLHGHGAGTFANLWARDRGIAFDAHDGHSLYLETMGELGVVGLVLVLAVVLTLLAGLLTRRRGPDRALYSALFAAVLAWALHAGIDWDWEMPVVTLWVFALGGAALASAPDDRRAPSVPGRLVRVVVAIGVLVLAVTPALAAVSQSRLDAAVRAFKRGDCRTAVDQALGASAALGARAEPFEILSYCDARAGLGALARQQMERAIARDRGNWEYHYGLAIVQGATGVDPRLEAREALALNRFEPLAREAVRMFGTADPRKWKRRALSARLTVR